MKRDLRAVNSKNVEYLYNDEVKLVCTIVSFIHSEFLMMNRTDFNCSIHCSDGQTLQGGEHHDNESPRASSRRRRSLYCIRSSYAIP